MDITSLNLQITFPQAQERHEKKTSKNIDSLFDPDRNHNWMQPDEQDTFSRLDHGCRTGFNAISVRINRWHAVPFK